MKTRLLSTSERLSFNLRHPSTWLTPIPEGGIYVQDDELHGFVLIYPKTDGTLIYVWTDSDPSSGDPSQIGYVASEFLKAVKQNTADVLKVGGIAVSTILIIAGIVFAILYFPQIKTLVRR